MCLTTTPFQQGGHLKEATGNQVLGKAGLYTHGSGEERLASLRGGRYGAPAGCVYKTGVSQRLPRHILAHRAQWALFHVMPAFSHMGPVAISLHLAALPLPHAHHIHCRADTVSLTSRDLPFYLEERRLT